MDILHTVTASQFKSDLPVVTPGDTIAVHVKVIEGNKERTQIFSGVCIKKHGNGINSTITVRKISNGVGVERIFPVHSPRVDKIELIRKGKVRRAKLYYLRKLQGKAARIQEES